MNTDCEGSIGVQSPRRLAGFCIVSSGALGQTRPGRRDAAIREKEVLDPGLRRKQERPRRPSGNKSLRAPGVFACIHPCPQKYVAIITNQCTKLTGTSCRIPLLCPPGVFGILVGLKGRPPGASRNSYPSDQAAWRCLPPMVEPCRSGAKYFSAHRASRTKGRPMRKYMAAASNPIPR